MPSGIPSGERVSESNHLGSAKSGSLEASSELFVSDVEMDMESDSEKANSSHIGNHQETPGALSRAVAVSQRTDSTSAKRKTVTEADQDGQDFGSSSAKKPKWKEEEQAKVPDSRPDVAEKRATDLPAALWHHIFSFCPPKTLGCLLCVNKRFNAYLDPFSSTRVKSPPVVVAASVLKPLGANDIWRRSRRLFWPNIPGPLRDATELEMWRLACSSTCQFCGKQDSREPRDASSWSLEKGRVLTIWAFRARCCVLCLEKMLVKEIDFLLSDVPTFLKPALPFIFMTPEKNIMFVSALERGPLLSSLDLTKVFWSQNVDSLCEEFESVKELGAPAVEEWQKGLASRGVAMRADAAKWEKFAESGGISLLCKPIHAQPAFCQAGAPCMKFTAASTGSAVAAPTTAAATSVGSASEAQGSRPSMAHDTGTNTSTSPDTGTAAGPKEQTAVPNVGPALEAPPLPSEQATADDSELLSSRRAEIHRLALLLNPPIPTAMLEKSAAFRAAIQSTAHLDDRAWELLKTKLLSKISQAGERPREPAPSVPPPAPALVPAPQPPRVVSAPHIEPRIDDTPGSGPRQVMAPKGPITKSKEQIDAEWDEMQGPVRLRILKYADEAIMGDWDDGEKVRKGNVAFFAMDVLLHVRERFYADVEKAAAAARAAGRKPVVDPRKGPFTQKLTLENMKYVFDVKVRPLTERINKEIFLCNGCDNSTFKKFYSFQAVIQHYAAKHTKALSAGNVVVNWRAEWPEVPPFKPKPRRAKACQSTLAPVPPRPLEQEGHRHDHESSQAPLVQQKPSLPATLPPRPPIFPQPFSHPAASFASGGPHQRNASQEMPCAPEPYPLPQQPSGRLPFAAPQHAAYSACPPAVPAESPFLLAPRSSQPVSEPRQLFIKGLAATAQHDDNAFSPERRTQQTDYELDETDLNIMARRARDLWNATAIMKDVAEGVRVVTVLHHLQRYFQEKTGKTLPLAMFRFGLLKDRRMRALRDVSGLSCRVCGSVSGDAVPVLPRKKYTLLQLASHFQSSHAGMRAAEKGPSASSPRYHWLTDMLHVPRVVGLLSIAGKDGRKYPLLYRIASDTECSWAARPPQRAPPASLPCRQDAQTGRPVPFASPQSEEEAPGETGQDEARKAEWATDKTTATVQPASASAHTAATPPVFSATRSSACAPSPLPLPRPAQQAMPQPSLSVLPPRPERSYARPLPASPDAEVKQEPDDGGCYGERRAQDMRFLHHGQRAQAVALHELGQLFGSEREGSSGRDLLDALERHLSRTEDGGSPVSASAAAAAAVATSRSPFSGEAPPATQKPRRVVYVDEHGVEIPNGGGGRYYVPVPEPGPYTPGYGTRPPSRMHSVTASVSHPEPPPPQPRYYPAETGYGGGHPGYPSAPPHAMAGPGARHPMAREPPSQPPYPPPYAYGPAHPQPPTPTDYRRFAEDAGAQLVREEAYELVQMMGPGDETYYVERPVQPRPGLGGGGGGGGPGAQYYEYAAASASGAAEDVSRHRAVRRSAEAAATYYEEAYESRVPSSAEGRGGRFQARRRTRPRSQK